MDLTELNARLRRGENLHTELKEWPVRPDDVAPAIVAFANTDGGQLMLGVNDEGQIVGIDEGDLDRVAQFVDNIAYQNCEPPVAIVQETVASEQGYVRIVHVPKGDQCPYRTDRGVYYIRTPSGRRQASREELPRLFQSAEGLYYDETCPIRTPGQLPHTVTIASLKQGIHVLRNPTIYNIFSKIGLVTDAGSGIPRMMRILRQKTGGEPDFWMEGHEFTVALPRCISL